MAFELLMVFALAMLSAVLGFSEVLPIAGKLCFITLLGLFAVGVRLKGIRGPVV